jgi:hypothetical protein
MLPRARQNVETSVSAVGALPPLRISLLTRFDTERLTL